MCVCMRRQKIQNVTCANQGRGSPGLFWEYYDINFINLNLLRVSGCAPPRPYSRSEHRLRAAVVRILSSHPLSWLQCFQTLRGPELLQLQGFKDIYPEDFSKFNFLICYDKFVELVHQHSFCPTNQLLVLCRYVSYNISYT